MNHFEKIASQLSARGLDAMLVTSAPGEFYAVGLHGEGMALITPTESWYYTDSRYIEVAQQQVTGARVGMIRTGQTYRQLAQAIVADKDICRLGFEDNYMSVAEYNQWKQGVTAEAGARVRDPGSAAHGQRRGGVGGYAGGPAGDRRGLY